MFLLICCFYFFKGLGFVDWKVIIVRVVIEGLLYKCFICVMLFIFYNNYMSYCYFLCGENEAISLRL